MARRFQRIFVRCLSCLCQIRSNDAKDLLLAMVKSGAVHGSVGTKSFFYVPAGRGLLFFSILFADASRSDF